MKFDSPDACRRHLMECAAKGDLERALEVYENDSVCVMDDGSVAAGITAIREAFAPYLRHKPKLEISVRRQVEIGRDLVVYYCDWHFQGVTPDGTVVPNAGSTLQVVRRQQDGGWRLILDDHMLSSH